MTTIAEIKKRLEVATPGPWEVSHHKGAGNLFRLENNMSANEFMKTMYSNLDLVRNAPTDIAFLLEQLERCRLVLVGVMQPEKLNMPRDVFVAMAYKEVFGDE